MRRNDEDANWYRAQIVLITTYAEWARNPGHDVEREEPQELRQLAYERAVGVAARAMRARDVLESLLGEHIVASEGEALDVPAGRRAHRGRRGDRSLDVRSAVELHSLLASTFEPGALLLVASNVSDETTSLRDRPVKPGRAGGRGKATRQQISTCRGKAKLEVERAYAALEVISDHDGRDQTTGNSEAAGRAARVQASVLIDYVELVPHKSPRVVYNLACYYSRDFESARTADLGEYWRRVLLRPAFERLRESIARTAPLERRGLLELAERDDDLKALRDSFGAEIAQLRHLLPQQIGPPGDCRTT